jgi:hypothetical protein
VKKQTVSVCVAKHLSEPAKVFGTKRAFDRVSVFCIVLRADQMVDSKVVSKTRAGWAFDKGHKNDKNFSIFATIFRFRIKEFVKELLEESHTKQ